MKNDTAVKLFGSVPRTRLMRFFLFGPGRIRTVAEAAEFTKVRAKDARHELKSLAEAGLLRSVRGKRTLRYALDERFPYTAELQRILLNSSLESRPLAKRLSRAGALKFIGVSGMFVGDFENHLDIFIVGDRVNESKLRAAIRALESDLGTELRYASMLTGDFLYRLTISDRFVRDFFDYPHHILLNRVNATLV